MRWLIVHPGPSFSVHDVCAGWVEALRELGEHVAVFNLDDRLAFYDGALTDMGKTDEHGNPMVRKALTHGQAIELAANGLLSAAMQFWPDVVLGISAFFTPPRLLDIIRARGRKVVLVATECPYQDAEQLERAAHADLNLVNDPVSLDAFRALGVPAEYVPHAYRPSVHSPGPASFQIASDLAFVGTGYASRIAFFQRMGLDGLDVMLAGNWQLLKELPDSPLHRYLSHDIEECLDNADAVPIYRSAKAGINFYRREGESSDGVAAGPREIEMAATGLWFLRDPRPEGDALFPMLPVFASPEDAGEQLRWWLAHDTQREQAAQAARQAVLGRTFASNARMLLRLLDRQPVTI
jgi:spore maturation protein CgeB